MSTFKAQTLFLIITKLMWRRYEYVVFYRPTLLSLQPIKIRNSLDLAHALRFVREQSYGNDFTKKNL